MRSSFALSLLSAIAALSATANAGFSNSHAILGWSRDPTANLESFRPFSAHASQQYSLKVAEEAGESCFPALIVSAPSFSREDLDRLSKSSTIRQELDTAQASLYLPYFQGASIDNLRTLIERRLASCNTPVVFRKAREFVKDGESSRAQWLSELDLLVESELEKLPLDRIVLISSVSDLSSHYRRKRQISDEDWTASDNQYTSASHAEKKPSGQAQHASVFLDEYTGAQQGNNTLNPEAGLLFHYSFTSPALILGSLVMLLVLIPAALLAVNAITSIELLKGLEGKMQGGQVGEGRKDQ